MAHKYRCDWLAGIEEWLAHFFPSELESYGHINDTDWVDFNPIIVAEIAHRIQPCMLPAALFEVTLRSVKEVIHPSLYLEVDTVHISETVINLSHLFREKYRLWTVDIYFPARRVSDDMPQNQCLPGCARLGRALDAFYKDQVYNILLVDPSNKVNALKGACRHCVAHARNFHEKKKAELWEKLPEWAGGVCWSDFPSRSETPEPRQNFSSEVCVFPHSPHMPYLLIRTPNLP